MLALVVASCGGTDESAEGELDPSIDDATAVTDDESDSTEQVDEPETTEPETTTETSEPETSESDSPAETLPLAEQTAPVTVTGDPLPPMPPQIPVTEPGNDTAIGQVAPDLTGTDFVGEPVEIVADGTPRVVMFVAHWCPHCQREVPAVQGLVDDGLLPDGLELVIVSTAVREGDDGYPPQRWLEAEGWTGQIMRDADSFDALVAFGAGGFPFSVYLNGNHEVVARSAGELPVDIITQLWLATVNG